MTNEKSTPKQSPHLYKYKIRAKRERNDFWSEWAAADDYDRAEQHFEYCRDVGFYASLWEHVEKYKYRKVREGEPNNERSETPRDNSPDGARYMPTQDELQSSVPANERVRRYRLRRTNAFKGLLEGQEVNTPQWVRKFR